MYIGLYRQASIDKLIAQKQRNKQIAGQSLIHNTGKPSYTKNKKLKTNVEYSEKQCDLQVYATKNIQN